MYQIWKFPLDVGANDLEMPSNPKFLHVGEQNGTLMVWALISTQAQVKTISIDVVGTGHPAPSESEGMHIGTVIVQNGAFVWHAFWMREGQ